MLVSLVTYSSLLIKEKSLCNQVLKKKLSTNHYRPNSAHSVVLRLFEIIMQRQINGFFIHYVTSSYSSTRKTKDSLGTHDRLEFST